MGMGKYVEDKRQELLHMKNFGIVIPYDAHDIELLRQGVGPTFHDVRTYLQGWLDALDWFDRVKKDMDSGGLA